jgi:para-aminobenzoate synthetase/4-amino-4-deoxychorismate lyase
MSANGAHTPRVRFDDLRSEPKRSFAMTGFRRAVVAEHPNDVIPALQEVAAATREGLWAAGFVSYEAAPGFDRSLRVRAAAGAVPLLWFGLFEGREDVPAPEARSAPAAASWEPSVPRERYDDAISAIRRHIEDGDTYQVNYTLRLGSPQPPDPDAFYADLCLAQGASYCVAIRAERFSVLSASPELFFDVDGDRITTRPMKGTAARGRTPDEDAEAAAALSVSEKDRAENAMIVDLLRNDLGRIAVPGSVKPTRLFATERYDTVWQMTSTVDARLRGGVGLTDVFRALFPSGSVTGAPKVRTMQLIAELETASRGVYTGAIGFVDPADHNSTLRASFNVAIRTVVLDHRTGRAEYGVGGGITHDSSAEQEYAECLTKARVLTERRPAFELLESMRYDPPSGVALLDEHLARLESSAGYFGFHVDRRRVLDELERATEAIDAPAKVRLMLARDGGIRITSEPLPAPPADAVCLAIDRGHPVDAADVLRAHKTTRRDSYEAALARHPEADDVVLLNARDEVVETATSNIAARLEGMWVTPPLDSGCLQGTARASRLASGELRERTILASELADAEELAVLNSVRGWRRARLGEGS